MIRRPSREQDAVQLVFDHVAATATATTREFKTHPTRAFRVDGVDYFNETGLKTMRSLAYDGQSGNFTAGQVVTGGTSGAVGTIVSDTDAGATGTLIIKDITGTFVDNEAITDPITGAAVVNGAATAGPSFLVALANGATTLASRSSAVSNFTADTFLAMTLNATDANLVVAAGSVLSLVLTETGDTTLPAGKVILRGRYL